MIYFYDTSALLDRLDDAFKEDKFFISNLTLKELENIKSSMTKDEDIKYKARRLIHLLEENFNKIEIITYQRKWDKQLTGILSDNMDSRIILCAWAAKYEKNKDLIFLTTDISCKHIAQAIGLQTEYYQEKEDAYCGFKEVQMNDVDLAKFYSGKCYIDKWDLMPNEYLLIKDTNNDIIDRYKYKESGELEKINYPCFESKMFGKIKPKDIYQLIAMDSLKHNKITVLRGAAGTGKSYLAMGYLFELLEKDKIDKIIIFCNTVATMGSAKLGFYPGSRDEKLLDSQIGNFLSSKLGDKSAVEAMVANGKIVLLPLSDIRGYDTTGLRAGIYITEAQNLNIDLMKLALQRIGEDCICILDGDDHAQVDMYAYAGRNNGLRRVSEVFRGEDIYGETKLQNIYRSRIAQLAEKMK